MTNSITPKDLLVFCSGAHYKKDIKGWNTIKVVNGSQDDTKLDASVYKNGDRIVIAFSGIYPNSETDLRNVLAEWNSIGQPHIPEQYGEAERLYNEIRAKYPNATIEFCGYSLGGSIANLLSHRTGLPATALAPIGSQHIAKAYPNYFKYDDSNITTYGREGDGYFRSNLYRQSGNIYIIPDLPTSWLKLS